MYTGYTRPMILEGEREIIRRHLIVDESLRLFPYWDCCGRSLRAPCTKAGGAHLGKLTIGIGRNLEDVGISRVEALELNDHDVDKSLADLRTFPWFQEQDVIRQIVLTELRFNLGPKGLRSFRNMLPAFARKDYEEAARHLKASKWWTDVQPSRARRLYNMTLSGEIA